MVFICESFQAIPKFDLLLCHYSFLMRHIGIKNVDPNG